MIVAGLVMAGAAPRRALVQIERWRIPRLFSRAVGRLIVAPGSTRRLALGAMMGFLPCGLIYAALLKAAATGSAVHGRLFHARLRLRHGGVPARDWSVFHRHPRPARPLERRATGHQRNCHGRRSWSGAA